MKHAYKQGYLEVTYCTHSSKMSSIFERIIFVLAFAHFGFLANGQCDDPIDLNTASSSELDSLPYITSTTAQQIIDFRPICSPLELTYSPKKISGITSNRVNNNWRWYSDQDCDTTCCRADASCSSNSNTPSPTTAPSTTYSYEWITGSWSDCSKDCDTGTQERSVTCQQTVGSVISTVIDAYCESDVSLSDKPASKQVCNTDECPNYEWISSQWSSCMTSNSGSSGSSSSTCEQTRNVTCYDTTTGTAQSSDANCDSSSKPDTSQSCDNCERTASEDSIGSNVDSVTVTLDILQSYNHEKCTTDDYYNLPDDNDGNLLIVRRLCNPDLWLFVKRASVDGSTQELDVSNWKVRSRLIKDVLNDDETDTSNFEDASSIWNGYLQWESMLHNTPEISGKFCKINIPETFAKFRKLLHKTFQHYNKKKKTKRNKIK